MSTHQPNHKEVIRREFTQQSRAYAANPLITDQQRLDRLLQLVQPQGGDRVLDVATGPGYVAMAFAEAGCDVVGLDITESPLTIAERTRQERGLITLRFQTGDAEHISFDDHTFNIIVSRYAFHHFEAPEPVLAEMARVCIPHGQVVIEDIVVSEHPKRAAYQNQLEQMRDPSHAHALPISTFLSLFTTLGLEVEQVITYPLTQNIEQWLTNARTPQDRCESIRAMIEQDRLHNLSGMYPYLKEGECYFTQRIAILIGRKLED